MGQRLPATALHRFPGEPRPGTDVDVYEWDGAQYVAASRKGVSFLNIYDSGSAGRSYHGSFQGSCSLMAPGAELSEGFSMVKGSALRWPPKQRGVPRHLQLEGQVVGWHYSLVPQHNMPLVSYTAEVERSMRPRMSRPLYAQQPGFYWPQSVQLIPALINCCCSQMLQHGSAVGSADGSSYGSTEKSYTLIINYTSKLVSKFTQRN